MSFDPPDPPDQSDMVPSRPSNPKQRQGIIQVRQNFASGQRNAQAYQYINGRPNLGHNESPLEAVIMEVYLNIPLYITIQQVYGLFAAGKFMTDAEITRDVQTQVYHGLYTYMKATIDVDVPRHSARLRNMMEISLRDHSNTGNMHPFKVVLDTGDIKYARYVNNMPVAWVQHPGTHGSTRRIRKGRKKTPPYLYDPQAKAGYFYTVTDKGRTYAERTFNQYLKTFAIKYLDRYSSFYHTTLAKQLGYTNHFNLAQALFSPRRFK